jgi:hypothetical protein
MIERAGNLKGMVEKILMSHVGFERRRVFVGETKSCSKG